MLLKEENLLLKARMASLEDNAAQRGIYALARTQSLTLPSYWILLPVYIRVTFCNICNTIKSGGVGGL